MQLDDGVEWRIFADEELMPPELVVAIILRTPLERCRDAEQMRVSCGGLRRRVFLNRLEMVEYPERAAMRRDEHRIVARVQRDLIDAHVREVGLEAPPAPAAIDGEEQSGLGAEVQYVGVLLVFSEGARDFPAQVGVE